MKSKANNIFSNQIQFERELNNEFDFINNKNKYEEKIEVDETVSSNHFPVESSKRIITTRNFDDELASKKEFVNIQNRSIKQQEVKNDMLDYEKNYKLFNENNNNNTNANSYSYLFGNFNSINNNNFDNNENSVQNSFLEKLSVLSDKRKSFTGTANPSPAGSNLLSAVNNNNFAFSNSFNNAYKPLSNNRYNNINNFSGGYANNSNSDSNLGNIINMNHHNINSLNMTHNNNNFMQMTNLTDIYFNLNREIAAGFNKDNFSRKKSDSRKNSTVNKIETITGNNNFSNNKNNNIITGNAIKRPGRKRESFRITKTYCDESSKIKLKESFCHTHLFNNEEEDFENSSPIKNKLKNFFIIEKLSKEEKEKEKDLMKLKRLEEPDIENEGNELSEDRKESYFSYNSEFFEKANYNDSTIKAIVSLRKLTFKKNSVDIDENNYNNINFNVYQNKNSSNEKSHFKDKNENLDLDEYKDLHAENNLEKNVILRKFSYKSFKENKKLSINSLNNLNSIKEYHEGDLIFPSNQAKDNSELSDNIINNSNNLQNSYSANPLIKENSFGGEPVRKESFIITKEIRRKDTELSNNPEKKMSIDEGDSTFLIKKNETEKNLLQPLKVYKVYYYKFLLISIIFIYEFSN